MAAARTIAFLLAAITFSTTAADVQPTTLERLHTYLLKDYDKRVRPVKDAATVTNVTFNLLPRYLLLHHEEEILYIRAWTYWEWNDEFLTWNPNQFDGIKEIATDSYNIWTPNVVYTSNGRVHNSLRSVVGGNCRVTSSGAVTCSGVTVYTSHCSADLTAWPFDEQFCQLRFVRWIVIDSEIALFLKGGKGFSLDYMRKLHEWDILEIDSDGSNAVEGSGYHSMRFNFRFKRHSHAYVATAVVPAVVLSVLPLLSLLLSPLRPERFAVCLIGVVALCVQLGSIYHDFRLNSTVPRLVLLFRDALLLCMLSLLQAVAVRAIASSGLPAPSFLLKVLDSVPAWPAGLSLLAEPRDDSGGRKALISAGAWRQFGSLLDRSCFVCFTLVVIILWAMLIP